MIRAILPSPATPNADLVELASILSREFGLAMPPERFADLLRNGNRAAAMLGRSGVEDLLAEISAHGINPEITRALSASFTVGETYFYRERAAIAYLEQTVFPELIERKRNINRTLRVWSAGCSTGEEAYTMMYCLSRVLPDFASWSIHVVGTDLNETAVTTAAAGVYGIWSLRASPDELKDSLFRRLGPNSFRVDASIKRHVSFRVANLARLDPQQPENDLAAMDVILCRNVFMYLTPSAIETAVRIFDSCLLADGYLILGAVDPQSEVKASFKQADGCSCSIFRPLRGYESTAFQARSGAESKSELTSSVASCQDGAGSVVPLNGFAADTAIAVNGESAAYLGFPLEITPAVSCALIAEALAARRQYESALHWCERALEADALNAELHYLMAGIALEAGDESAAKNSLLRSIYLDPRRPGSHRMLADLYQHQSRSEASARHQRMAKRWSNATPALYESAAWTAAVTELAASPGKLDKMQRAAGEPEHNDA